MGKHYKLEFTEKIQINDKARNLAKSGKRLNSGKPRKEIEQYIGNKDKDVISEFERKRKEGEKTKVIHRLWRKLGNTFKKVHEHEK